MANEKTMTVGELRKLLTGINDDVLVLVDSYEGDLDSPNVWLLPVHKLEQPHQWCGKFGICHKGDFALCLAFRDHTDRGEQYKACREHTED